MGLTSWPVLERWTAELGKAVGESETKMIYDYLVNNAGTATTGDGDGNFEWVDLVKLYSEIDKID